MAVSYMSSVMAIPSPVKAICAAVLGASVILTVLSHNPDLPAWITGLTLMLSGLAWFCLPGQISLNRISLLLALGIGLSMRLIYFASEPIREIDYYRYLWDAGAVQAGLNPFSVAPTEAILGLADKDWQNLVAQSGGIAEQISYGHLSSIYPPVGQAAFWLAHQIDPWSLTGLRLVFLLAELAGVLLLILLLKEVGKSPAWVAIYWWNPLIAKELINSAHMDALLVPALVGATLMAVRSRPVWSAVALGVAAGTKIWPLVLAPILIWQGRWRVWMTAGIALVFISFLMALPIILGRLDSQSGLVAYAGGWERNHALFGIVRSAIEWSADELGFYRVDPGRIARMTIVLGLGISALVLGWWIKEKAAIPMAALIVAALLLLLSPTGYPWYYVWALPFLCIVPVRGLLLLGVVMPFYYLRFDMDQGQIAYIFDQWIVWLEFGPVFALLAYDGFVRSRR